MIGDVPRNFELAAVPSGKGWCGRWESNPHEEKSPEDFHAVYGFRRPDARALERSHPVCGLDYPFTIPQKLRGLGAARLVSTPSRLDSFAGLGSGSPSPAFARASSGFPEFEQFCIAGFPASTQVFP